MVAADESWGMHCPGYTDGDGDNDGVNEDVDVLHEAGDHGDLFKITPVDGVLNFKDKRRTSRTRRTPAATTNTDVVVQASDGTNDELVQGDRQRHEPGRGRVGEAEPEQC